MPRLIDVIAPNRNPGFLRRTRTLKRKSCRKVWSMLIQQPNSQKIPVPDTITDELEPLSGRLVERVPEPYALWGMKLCSESSIRCRPMSRDVPIRASIRLTQVRDTETCGDPLAG